MKNGLETEERWRGSRITRVSDIVREAAKTKEIVHVEEEMHGDEARALKLERKRLEHKNMEHKKLEHKRMATEAGAQEVEHKSLSARSWSIRS